MNDPAVGIVSDLTENQPEPQAHAIAKEAERDAAQKAEWAELRDTKGEPFDPAIHQTQGDGSPSLTPSGKLKRRPGRKAGSTSTVAKPKAEGKTQESCQSGPEDAARATIDGISVLGAMLGGDEWNYIKDDEQGIDERKTGISAFTRMYEERGINDIPPGVAVAIWGMSYVAVRVISGPKTKSRLAKVKTWFVAKVLRRRATQMEKEVEGD